MDKFIHTLQPTQIDMMCHWRAAFYRSGTSIDASRRCGFNGAFLPENVMRTINLSLSEPEAL